MGAEHLCWHIDGQDVTVTLELRQPAQLGWVAHAEIERWGASAFGQSREHALQRLEQAVRAWLDPDQARSLAEVDEAG